jgi:hypothetical protein
MALVIRVERSNFGTISPRLLVVSKAGGPRLWIIDVLWNFPFR